MTSRVDDLEGTDASVSTDDLPPSGGGTSGRWGRLRSLPMVFAVCYLIFGGIMTVGAPPFWGFDEISHVGRAYQIAHGGVLPERIDDDRGVAYGGEVPVTVRDLMDYALYDYKHHRAGEGPLVADASGYTELKAKPLDAPAVPLWFTNTAAYSPVSYLPAAVGLWAAEATGGSVGTALLLMRVADLLAFGAAAAYALVILKETRLRWIAFITALIPITVFQAATVSADGPTNALCLLFSAVVAKAVIARQKLSRAEVVTLVVCSLALPLTKPTFVVLLPLVLLVPRTALPRRAASALRWGTVAISGALFAAWTAVSGGTTQGMGLMRVRSEWHSVDPSAQLRWIVEHPLGLVATVVRTGIYRDQLNAVQFFGELGVAYVQVPVVTIVAVSAAFLLALGTLERFRPGRRALAVMAVTLAAAIAAVYATLYLAFSPVGFSIVDGMQGRYLIPFVVLGIALLASVLPLRLALTGPRTQVRVDVVVVVLAVGALAMAWLKYLYLVWL